LLSQLLHLQSWYESQRLKKINLEEESPYNPDVPGSCSKSGIVRKSAR